MKELKINVGASTKTIEVLQGEVLKPQAPLKLNIKGLIDGPYRFLQKRVSEIDQKKCMLIVNTSELSMRLIVDEKDHYCDVISGSLKINPDFEKFSINTGKKRDTFELADFIKMNRVHFADKSIAIKLVSELKNFKAKVDKDVELSNNDRGNSRVLLNQVVDSNIPEGFDLSMAIFKGAPPSLFKVEININASDFGCSLISPVANDMVKEMSEKAIGEQLDLIKKIASDLVIIHE